MKKNILFKCFVSLLMLNSFYSAKAQYFKPSIDGSWLYKTENILKYSKNKNDVKITACKLKLFW